MISFAGQRGGTIKSIQRGVATLTHPATSVTVTITSVDPAYTELRLLGTSVSSGSTALPARIRLASATTIVVDGVSLTGIPTSISWELTEYYPT